ncbi:MAG: protein kinase, partial [Deltaproteobacteria bacterium]|nr:protein kinase [Deltaproteobacteria bacterium]
RLAIETGLVDDLGWIAEGPAAVALYELSAALPPGRERRELGRRVFARLYEGGAATFSAVATRMALGPGRPFEVPTLRARIGLVLNLPIGSTVNCDPLALAILSRRELLDRWISRSVAGALPARRLTARLFERAAREAVRRHHQGDPVPAELLTGSLRPIFDRLLADREPLVWRHAAVARGLLLAVSQPLRDDVETALDPGLTPTEWRRAAVSTVASIATDVSAALISTHQLLTGDLAARDPGLAATLCWGLPPVIESEPEAAIDLLDRLSFTGRADVAEAMAALLSDVANPEYAAEAALRIRSLLIQKSASVDPALQAVYEDALRGLDSRRTLGGVHAAVRHALELYETTGARAAYEASVEALARAHGLVDALTALGNYAELADLLGPLGDLDASAIEQSRLHDLLLLGRSPGDAKANVPELENLHDRLGTWILNREEHPAEQEFSRGELLGRQRTLRALLHLADMDAAARVDGEADAARARLRRMVTVLLRVLAAGPDASVHRLLSATLARALDAAAREGVADPADLLLVVIDRFTDAHTVTAMFEASTQPDVRDVLRAHAAFLAQGGREDRHSSDDLGADSLDGRDEGGEAHAFVRLSAGIGTNGAHRGEALRQVVLRIGRALESIGNARSLSDLVEPPSGEGYPLGDLEHHVDGLRRLLAGARRRVLLGDDALDESIEVVADVARLTALVERAVTGVPPNRLQLSMAIGELTADLPPPMAGALSRVLVRIAELPLAAATVASAIPLQARRTELPAWLMPRRTIGAFHVVRALGSGGVSSVFVARRLEERRTPGAEVFALKVPQYDPTTARSLSEQEFLQLFREEAGALLSLPQHPNLSRFVTFDLAARPKPILVMELIPGFALDRSIRNRSLTAASAFEFLDGILAGLDAMHGAGVGHLDVKPSNVILRDGRTPVLVDFGLSGRHLRPGCGTLEYCAPEILGIEIEGARPTPAAADVYAFAATAFEVVTGTLLFDADDEVTLMQQHITHDGWPDRLRAFAQSPEFASLAVLLAACLRRDPGARPSVAELRRALPDATRWLT